MTHHLPIRVYYEDTDMAGIVMSNPSSDCL